MEFFVSFDIEKAYDHFFLMDKEEFKYKHAKIGGAP